MSGDARSLQNCCGADKVLGGFDSHTPPPLAELLRQIPSVSEMLNYVGVKDLCKSYGEGMLKSELRILLEEIRADILKNGVKDISDSVGITALLSDRLLRFTEPIGRYVINATGILLHTGFGRAPLCKEALEALGGMGSYSTLQTDLVSGERSMREAKIERMLIELTGCEAVTVVNNNASATMLILNTLAPAKRVLISRGQLIEIGGEFRMPDVMEKSSAILHEVGTTNRTHLHDYERAIDENTGAILHVHTSNYRVRGFSGTPDIRELCALGRKHNIPVIDDIGSGSLINLSRFGLADEPLVTESVLAGSDVICFSGDKLICGPQSGIICGKKEIIERIRKNAFARMFRVCKLTISALEATLLHFINDTYTESIPFYRMLCMDLKTLESRAGTLMGKIKDIKDLDVKLIDDVSYVGSGSLPDEGIPTKVVSISLNKKLLNKASIEKIALNLRLKVPSVFCRVNKDSLCFDMRTLFDGEEIKIAERLKEAIKDVRI